MMHVLYPQLLNEKLFQIFLKIFFTHSTFLLQTDHHLQMTVRHYFSFFFINYLEVFKQVCLRLKVIFYFSRNFQA